MKEVYAMHIFLRAAFQVFMADEAENRNRPRCTFKDIQEPALRGLLVNFAVNVYQKFSFAHVNTFSVHKAPLT